MAARYEKCIARIQKAAGKQLTDSQVDEIFSRINKAARDINAGKEPAKISNKKLMNLGWKMQGAVDTLAAEVAKQLEAEASLIEYQAHRQVLALGARLNDHQNMIDAGVKPLDAAEYAIVRNYRGINIESLEQRISGYKRTFGRQLLPAWDALGKDFLGFWQDSTKLLDLIKEIRGEDTGNALAKKGAKVWEKVTTDAREIFNSMGGKIGELDDWGMPQHHSQAKVAYAAKSGDDATNMKAWVDYITPKLDRSRYVDDAGAPWTDEQMRLFLEHAWDTIATNGIANLEPGEYRGKGKVANRHAEERQLHFKDADSVIQYWEQYSDKTALEIMMGHMETMARDISMVEKFGPNPDTTWNTLRDTALKTSVMDDKRNTPKYENRAGKLDNLYNYATGKTKPVASPTIANIGQTLQHLNTAGKMGGSALASLFGDRPMQEAVSHMNNLPLLQRWTSMIRLLNPTNVAERRLLQQNGLMLDIVRSGLNRFNETLGDASFSGKLASAVLRMTGMTAINEIPKASFAMNTWAAIGHELANGRTFDKLHESDVRLLRNWGITDTEWKTWGLAKGDTIAGVDNITTPEAVQRITDDQLKAAGIIGQVDGPEVAEAARRNAIIKLLGAVEQESEFAIVTPGIKERAQFYGGAAQLPELQRGTFGGELGRSILQFKSFPWAYIQRGRDLLFQQEGGWSKAGATVYLVVSATLAGAMLMQTREILGGKDPRNMVGSRRWQDLLSFWGAAFVNGGALGIYGDFLYSANQTRYGSGPLEALAGPIVGPALEAGLVAPMNAARGAMDDKDTHLGATLLRDTKGFVPGGNIWYAKTALDHMVWMQVMEMLSPGYLSSIRQKTRKEYGQDWWYGPGEMTPSRAPDLSKAVSE